MKTVEGSEYKVDAELVLIAAGFLGSESYLTKAFGVEVDGRTNIATAEALILALDRGDLDWREMYR